MILKFLPCRLIQGSMGVQLSPVWRTVPGIIPETLTCGAMDSFIEAESLIASELEAHPNENFSILPIYSKPQ